MLRVQAVEPCARAMNTLVTRAHSASYSYVQAAKNVISCNLEACIILGPVRSPNPHYTSISNDLHNIHFDYSCNSSLSPQFKPHGLIRNALLEMTPSSGGNCNFI